MGQFIDHDLTFDLTSRLAVVAEPLASPNERTPRLRPRFRLWRRAARGSRALCPRPSGEPGAADQAADRQRRTLRRLASQRGRQRDHRRPAQRREHHDRRAAGRLHHVSQQGGRLRPRPRPHQSSEEVFEKARQLTTWHYQWMIVHEFLPLFIGQPLVNDILRNGRRFYRPEVGFIPVEFQGAAYRFGHTMVRPSYRANLAGDDDGSAFFAMIFDPRGEGQSDPIDLRGGARAQPALHRLANVLRFRADVHRRAGQPQSGHQAQQADRHEDLDAAVPPPVGAIAGGVGPGDPISLPQRNLLRHITWANSVRPEHRPRHEGPGARPRQ